VPSVDLRDRITMLDGMVLIAATAIGLAAGRAQVLSRRPGSWWGVDAHTAGVWFALAWSIALIVLQVRPGRRDRRRLWARPGFAACVAVVASLAVILVHEAALKRFFAWKRIQPFRLLWSDLFDRIYGLFSISAPCCAAAVWAVLALAGRWVPGRDWREHLGLLLGLYWLAWPPLAWIIALGA
jgi:hypothetical protein